MPKRKLTKVEDCLLTNGIDIDAIKCLNWKYMDTHPGKFPCLRVPQSFAQGYQDYFLYVPHMT